VPRVTLAVPWSVKTTGIELDEPTVTFPNVNVVELGDSCDEGATPVPVSMMLIVGSDASLETVKVPWLLPAFEGVNITVIVVV